MWDNHHPENGTEPPKLDVARVGVSLTLEAHNGALLVADYPNVLVAGMSRSQFHPLVNTEPYEVRLGVSDPESGSRYTLADRIPRHVDRDLDLRIRGRVEPVRADGAAAFFLDVDKTREHTEKTAEENRALRREVRALRARVKALGGDK